MNTDRNRSRRHDAGTIRRNENNQAAVRARPVNPKNGEIAYGHDSWVPTGQDQHHSQLPRDSIDPSSSASKHIADLRKTVEDNSAFTSRQLSGLRALIALAHPEVAIAPFSGAAVRQRHNGEMENLARQPSLGSAKPEPIKVGSHWTRMGHLIRRDQMLRSSLYLTLNSGAQAALGFVFWVITARLFNTVYVGRASSLISASGIISFFGLLALNFTFLRYLPTAPKRNSLITAGIVLVGACSGGIALMYALLTPLFARPISFVAHSIPLLIGFVVLTACATINGLTDSVFIVAGKSGYNAFIDGVIGGVSKIFLLVLLVGGGTYGIFCASVGGFVPATLLSLVLMARVLHWRPQFENFRHVLKPVLRFSGMNYAGSVLNSLPILVVPLIVLNRLGASASAYYYVSFQLAAVIYTAVYAVEQSFLAEGAHAGTIGHGVLMRSIRILLALCIPAFVAVLLFGHQMLMLFGSNYASHSERSLILLAAAVLPIGANNWFLNVLRLSNQLKAIVCSNAVYAVAIIGLAFVLAPRGIGAVALAWPVGTSAGALVAGIAAIGTIRRHRASKRQSNLRTRRSA